MAQPETGRQTVRLPFVGYEKAYNAAPVNPQAWEWPDQAFVNCFPVVNKNPVTPDAGEVVIMSRPGVRDPVQTNNDLGTALVNMLTLAEPMCVLGLKGFPTDTVMVVYAGYDNVAAQNQLRIVAYTPGVSSTLVGTINITSYGLTSGTVEAHLTQITNGAGLVGVAISFHPENYRTSTSANSDVYYSIYSGGVWGALAAIGDIDFPTNTPAKGIVGALVQLNNVHYIMTTDGYIYGSYPSTTFPFNPDITAWNAQGNTTTTQAPDGGMGLVRYKHHLLAFGQNSCEFFNDEGLAQPNLPIRRTQQAFFKIGLLNARAYVSVDDDLYFLGISGDSGHIGMYRLSGYSPELVSSIKINTALQDRAHYLAKLQVANLNGTRHIITNVYHSAIPWWDDLPAAEAPTNTDSAGVLCYCIDSNAWWIWSFDLGDVNQNQGRVNIQVANTPGNNVNNEWIWVVINLIGSGGINYSLHPSQIFSYLHISNADTYDALRQGNSSGPVVTDNFTIPVLYVSNRYDLGSTNRKTIHKIRLVADRPYTKNTGSDPSLSFYNNGHSLALSLYKDAKADNISNGTDYDLSRTYDLKNLIDNPTMDWNNLGTMRKFRLRLQCSTWIYLRLEALEVTFTTAQH